MMRLLAFSMVAAAMSVTLRPPEGLGAHEPFYKDNFPVDETVGFLNDGHSDVCDPEAPEEAREPTNLSMRQCCGTVTIYYGSGSGSDF